MEFFTWSVLDRAQGSIYVLRREAGEASYGTTAEKVSAMPCEAMGVQYPQNYLQSREESHYMFISTNHRIWAGPGEGA